MSGPEGAHVLVLGGTAEARALAAALVAQGHRVLSSLAGRVAQPRLPEGEVRIGGFGGVEGLVRTAREFDVVVDATHPFARRISDHAAAASGAPGAPPLLRLARPGWTSRAGWHLVDDVAAAAARTATLGRRPVLTTGRQDLATFVPPLREHAVLARVVDAPEGPLPPGWTLRRDRGPYTLPGETALLREHRADVLVTKDSGGALTAAKLDAAERLGVPVVVVRRPTPAAGLPPVPHVDDVDAALAWVTQRVQERSRASTSSGAHGRG